MQNDRIFLLHNGIVRYIIKESCFVDNKLNFKTNRLTNGKIKNCPNSNKSFGNINNTPLSAVLKKDDFRAYWNITKDKIKICKDCEFRYFCYDFRVYISDPEDIYSKPIKCKYNPYEAKWEK